MLTEIDLSVYLICVFIGIVIAAVYAFYNKNILGSFVRRLLEEGCDSEENGLTLRELGFDKSSLVRFALRPTSSLTRVVEFTSGEETAEGGEKVKARGRRSPKTDLDSAVFYIPAEKAEKASRTYDSHGTTILSVALTIVVFFFVFVVSYFLLPLIFDVTNSFYSDDGGGLIKITGSEDYDFSDVIEADRLEQEKHANKK